MSKGSWRRPAQVSKEELSNNWEQIFGKKKDDHKKEGGCQNCGNCKCGEKNGNNQSSVS